MFLGADTVLVIVRAAKIDFLTSPCTIYTFGFEAMFRYIYDIFPQGMSVNHTIVKVYDNELLFYWFQDAVCRAHKLPVCVCQARQLHSPLVQVIFDGIGHLLPVSYCDRNLLVSSRQVQFCERAEAVHGVE
jgi:hypothetical protein